MSESQPGAASPATQEASRKYRLLRRNSLIALGIIGAIGGTALVWAWSGRPAANSIRFEVAKTALQVMAVAVLGAVTAMATFNFQYSRQQEAAQRERQAELDQREAERSKDQRARQDDLLRAVLLETLRAYNRVKRLRRLLRAETAHHDHRRVTLEVYHRYMSDLNDQQLKFEELARRAPLITDERLRPSGDGSPTPSIVLKYQEIETYLNKVINEFEDNRYRVADQSDGLPLTELPRLAGFLEHRRNKECRPADFKVASAGMGELLKTMERAVQQPPNEPVNTAPEPLRASFWSRIRRSAASLAP